MEPYYQDEATTIYHGDCREILPSLGKFDLLLTDPPYGIGFAAQPTLWQRLDGKKPEQWDDVAPIDTVSLSVTYCVDSIVWGGNYFDLPTSRCWLAWTKPDSPPSMGSVELAWTTFDRPSAHVRISISRTNGERVGHPTQKPLALMRWCLSFAPDAKTILDPFMGSGTTLVAAKLEGRTGVGIELEERYCEKAANRLRQGVLNFGD